MRVAFLAPIIPTRFFDVVSQMMGVAAEQLGIDLEIVDGTLQRNVFIERGLALAERTPKPDYVVLTNFLSAAPELLRRLGAAGIETLVAFEPLSTADQLELEHAGAPGYLGAVGPDDVEAGRALAESLVTEARRRKLADPDGMIQVGILSIMQAQVSSDRLRGWLKFRDAAADVVQSGLGVGGATEGGLCAATKALLAKAPRTSVLWCFNDGIALDARKAAAEVGRRPGQDLLIGGIDLLDRALASIGEGSLHVSLGGHVVDGVRILLHLLDRRAKGDRSALKIVTRMQAVTAQEAGPYRRFMQAEGWRRSDFTRFSLLRAEAPELSLRALIEG